MKKPILTTTTTVYYHPLVRWEKIDEIVFLTQPHEHPVTRELVLKSLDHAVLEAALLELSEEDQEAFLEMCRERYHDEELLNWLEQRSDSIRDTLTKAIRDTKQEIYELLAQEAQK